MVLARQGAGLIQTCRYLFERELAAGSLVEVLPQYAGCSRPHSQLYPSGRHVPLRLRAFVDFLMEQRRNWQG